MPKVPVHSFNTEDEKFLTQLAKSLLPCPICGNKTFIKVRGILTLLHITQPPKDKVNPTRNPAWCSGPWTIGCSFEGCKFAGSQEIYGLDSLVAWWNNLPRKADYGQTWDKEKGYK